MSVPVITPASLVGLSLRDRALAVPLTIVATLVIALVLRWLVRRLIDHGVRTLSDNTFARRLARARAAHDGPEAANLLAERAAARARTVGSLLKSIAGFTILFLAGLVVLGSLGVDITPILASAGNDGIAVGFGAQSLVKDFLTGIFMIFEDQYGVGDLVDTGAAVGTVEQVGLRVTRLRDDQGVVWYVPNGSITRVGNKSQGSANAVVDVQVAYGTDLPALQQVLTDTMGTLAHDPEWDPVILDEPALVSVETMSEDAVVVRVTLRTQPSRHTVVAREMRARLRSALEAAGIATTKPLRSPH